MSSAKLSRIYSEYISLQNILSKLEIWNTLILNAYFEFEFVDSRHFHLSQSEHLIRNLKFLHVWLSDIWEIH